IREDVVVAHIARLALSPDGDPLPPTADPNQPFSEMAMYVLVRRGEDWWPGCGTQHPDAPGRRRSCFHRVSNRHRPIAEVLSSIAGIVKPWVPKRRVGKRRYAGKVSHDGGGPIGFAGQFRFA